MLSTKIVDYLKHEPRLKGHPVIHFYCDPSESDTLRPTYIFKSLIRQLLEHGIRTSKTLPSTLRTKLEQCATLVDSELDLQEVNGIFTDLFELYPHAFYVLDGIDEMEAQDVGQMVSMVYELFASGSTQKVLLASRKEIGRNNRIPYTTHLSLSASQTNDDMSYYIEYQIHKKSQTKKIFAENASVIQRIRRKLLEGAQGM